MSFAGHVIDSINRMKYNRDQLLSKRKRVADLKSLYMNSIKIKGYQYQEDNIPREVVEKVKSEIKKTIRRERIRSVTLSIVVTLMVVGLIIFLFIKYVEI